MNHTDLYRALFDRDASFDGKIFAAVKTTGVFCRPSCSCKKPFSENVIFYDSIETCISLGYRECKICNPLASLFADDETANYAMWIEKETSPAKTFREHPIESVDMLERLKKQFYKQAKLSLGKYIRLKRVNYCLRENEANDTKLFAHYIHSPIGIMIALHTEKGLCLLEFADRKMLEGELKEIQKHTHGNFFFATTMQSQRLEQQLKEYFSGHRKIFDVPLDFIGTDFQKKVWKLLLEIPYGESVIDSAIKH
jgi:AraC family transcriptional regulator of adaptative response/methylated-DNA-[protein]-cysteine methyltransferase